MLIGLLVLAALIAGSAMAFIASWWNPTDWNYYREVVDAHRGAVAAVGGAYAALAAVFAFTMLFKRKDDYISFEREGGSVSIKAEVVEDVIRKIAPEFPAIVRMEPRVMTVKDGVEVVVDVRIKASPQIRALCELLQERVREGLQTGLGLTNVLHVEVNVKKIIGQVEPGLKSMSEDEEI